MYRTISKYRKTPFLFVILFVMPIYAQVVIRDTIYTEKENNVKLFDETQCLQLRAVFTYSGTLLPSQQATLKIIGCTGTATQTIAQTTGGWSAIVEANPYSGSTNIKAQFYPANNQSGVATIEVYLGEAKIASTSGNYGCGINGCTSASVLQTNITLYDQLIITPQDAIIYHGDSQQLIKALTAHNCYENAIWHNSSYITLEIIQGSDLGTFVDNAGNIIGNSVTTTLANLNDTRFVANGRQPCSIELVKIKAYSGCVSMINQFYVENTGSPVLSLSVSSTDVRPSGTGGTTTTMVTVTATNCGPVSGVPITLSVQPIDYSGGHDHTNISTRPKGTFDQATGITDVDGVFTALYTAPSFSGKEKITATSTQVSDVKSVEITVKVPGLVAMPPLSSAYVLVGTPDNHSGTDDPCRIGPPTSMHYQNHFGTQKLNTAVQNIAAKYDSCGFLRLRINDMSLAMGGGFDVGNNWGSNIIDQYTSDPKRCNDVGHCTHRLGINADIGHKGVNAAGNCENVNLKELRRIIRLVTGRPSHREGNHEHITVK